MNASVLTTGRFASLFRGLLGVVGAGILLLPVFAHAELPAAADDPFGSMDAVMDEELAGARGGAVLPNGMTVEVTGLMRVMVDGQHLSTSTFGDYPLGSIDSAMNFPIGDAPASIINSLDGISLDHYREINFYISKLPTNFSPAPFVPRMDVTQSLVP